MRQNLVGYFFVPYPVGFGLIVFLVLDELRVDPFADIGAFVKGEGGKQVVIGAGDKTYPGLLPLDD